MPIMKADAIASGVMRLLRFRHGDRIATGVADTGARTPSGCSQGTFFEDPLPTGEELALDEVELLAPGAAVEARLRGQELRGARGRVRAWRCPDEPLLFLKPSTAVIGPLDPIRLLPMSQRVDYEGELAVVIGRLARRTCGPRTPTA